MIIRTPRPTRRTFGRYEIIGHIATGGMADVWLARTPGRGGREELVALKTLLPTYTADQEFVQMFIREALIAAKLSHPGIVQILELGTTDGMYFIAMEYVPGASLRYILRTGRKSGIALPMAPVLNALAECCDALHYAHSCKLIHRDISPENIMISETGHSKIVDFGIVASGGQQVTKVGRIKGKYAYMSPETFSAAPPHRSRDIWALGIVLYELATGRRPFDAENEADLVYRIAHAEIAAPRLLAPAISEELEWTILRCLSKRPEQRPSSANELAAMLRILMHQEIARGEDESMSRLLEIAGISSHTPEPELIEVRSIDDGDRLERTSDILFGARHVLPAQDTGDLFPAVRAKPGPVGFDIFAAYSRKKKS